MMSADLPLTDEEDEEDPTSLNGRFLKKKISIGTL